MKKLLRPPYVVAAIEQKEKDYKELKKLNKGTTVKPNKPPTSTEYLYDMDLTAFKTKEVVTKFTLSRYVFDRVRGTPELGRILNANGIDLRLPYTTREFNFDKIEFIQTKRVMVRPGEEEQVNKPLPRNNQIEYILDKHTSYLIDPSRTFNIKDFIKFIRNNANRFNLDEIMAIRDYIDKNRQLFTDNEYYGLMDILFAAYSNLTGNTQTVPQAIPSQASSLKIFTDEAFAQLEESNK